MIGKYPLSFLRCIEQQWVERIKMLRQVRRQIVVAIERILQGMFDNNIWFDSSPVRTVVDRRRLIQGSDHMIDFPNHSRSYDKTRREHDYADPITVARVAIFRKVTRAKGCPLIDVDRRCRDNQK